MASKKPVLRAKVQGFTLLELLVAVAVFAVIAALASSGFSSVLNSATRSEEQMDRLAELQKAMIIIARDVQHALDRPIRDEFGSPSPPFIGSQQTELLEFSRTGRRNPTNIARSHIQRVGYRLDDETLYRQSWPVLDRAQDSEPLEGKLIEGITEIEIRYLDESRQWQNQWPPLTPSSSSGTPAAALPLGVEITFGIEGLGSVPRIFRISG